MRGLGNKSGRTTSAAVDRLHTLSPDGARLAYHIDRWSAEEIAGWVTDLRSSDSPVVVRFSIDGIPVGLAVADMARVDVEKAGRGPRNCGFHFAVPPGVALLWGPDRPVTLEALIDPPVPFGEVALTQNRAAEQKPSARSALRAALDNLIAGAASLEVSAGEPVAPAREPDRFPLHECMFADARDDDGHTLSPYLAFTRRRLRAEHRYPLDGSEAARNAYLRWYIDVYTHQRKPLRTPLGAREIAYLNEPVRLAGVPHKVSRASLSYALSDSDAAKLMPIQTLSQYERFLAWWCAQRAASLHMEDCLVPDYYVEVLRRVPIPSMTDGWPLSIFMSLHHHTQTRFHVLDLTKESDRLAYHVWFLMEAVEQPGLIRFMPLKCLGALLAGPDGSTEFDRVLQSVHEAGRALASVFTAKRLETLLLRRDFDIARRRFINRDQRGNRFEAASRGPARTPRETRVPVQLIGPLEKSSGLGQATRMSAATLRASGIETNFVDFGRDNPSPVGMNSASVAYDAPRPAKVNLLHLNGETLPIALAYMPDVFNGAYNIGYFFWELSTPPIHQGLAIELCDEIWVASEYGVSIYRDATDKPVFCAGMAFDPVEEPSRGAARAYLQSRTPAREGTFVCLATFDSFSFLERKNPHGLCEAFLSAFDADEDVLLILKTHNRDFVADPHQQLRWDRIFELANSDPRVFLVNETLPFSDLLKLKKGADAYLSLHRSEGWGFGMLEAMSIGTPVLSTGYSGNMDFTHADTAWLVDYDLIEPEANEYAFVERGQKWAAPRLDSAVAALRAMRGNPEERARRAAKGRRFVHETYSIEARARCYRARLQSILRGSGR